MKNLRLIFTLAAMLGVSGAAFAQAEINELWTSLDTNQDALVSQEEWEVAKMLPEQWSLLDSNSDGVLSPLEFSLLGSKQ